VVRLAADLDGQNRPNGRCPSYGEIRDVACRMEGAGFDVLWFAVHLLYRYENQSTMGIESADQTLGAGRVDAADRARDEYIVLVRAGRAAHLVNDAGVTRRIWTSRYSVLRRQAD